MVQKLNKQHHNDLHDVMIAWAQELSKSELRMKSYEGLKVKFLIENK
jgi:hypothetical protein